MVAAPYPYEDFLTDIRDLASQIDSPECLLAISRGGLMPGLFLSHALNNPHLFIIEAKAYQGKKRGEVTVGALPNLENFSNALLVDEIVDSGHSMQAVTQAIMQAHPNLALSTAALFYKKDAIFQPDYAIREAVGWIDFFWEVDGRMP